MPGTVCLVGSDRYAPNTRSGGKPSYSFMAYDFTTFSEASYACWDLSTEWGEVLRQALRRAQGRHGRLCRRAAPGVVKHDREIWDAMVETINRLGYEGKIGIQVDVATETYWEEDQQRYVGIFSAEPKTKEDIFELYLSMVKKYPFVIIEDPFDEDDYETTARLTKAVDIQIVGDDLFTTNPERVQQGIDVGAANTVLLKVNQIGTITEAFDMIQLAYQNGYGVMPCSSRGEGADIADYCVGINAGTVRETGTGPGANRFLEIEAELGSRAKFAGRKGLKGARFRSSESSRSRATRRWRSSTGRYGGWASRLRRGGLPHAACPRRVRVLQQSRELAHGCLTYARRCRRRRIRPGCETHGAGVTEVGCSQAAAGASTRSARRGRATRR